MSTPTLTPASQTSAIVLPVTGALSNATTLINYAFGIYADTNSTLYDKNFISGAIDQVSYTYKKLGGDILDIELTEQNIYSAYEESVLEYSYIVNIHQAKNSLPSVLGDSTGSFDHNGLLSGSTTPGSNIELKYPKLVWTATNTNILPPSALPINKLITIYKVLLVVVFRLVWTSMTERSILQEFFIKRHTLCGDFLVIMVE